MAGELLRCKNVIRSEIGVHEPIERLIHAEEGSGKDSVKLRINLNQQL